MGKKKLNIVYSTNPDFHYEYDTNDKEELLPPGKQALKVRFEKKHRAGKKVTVISGFTGPESDLKDLAKLLKSRCAVGGSVKDQEILLQGDLRDKIKGVLLKEGYSVKG
jgi:translation initiation factor 1